MTIEATVTVPNLTANTLEDVKADLKGIDLRTLPKDARQPIKNAREAVTAALKALKD